MCPIIEKDGKYFLDDIEKIKLRLLWLSCKDFGTLRQPKTKALLKNLWINRKSEMHLYFQNYTTSLDSIINTFKKVNFTIDPRLPSGYHPEKNILIFNLWSFFYAVAQCDYAIPTPAWKLGGELVHEHDHYKFITEHNMIGKTEKEYERFNKKYLRKLEKRAFLILQNFLGNCKKNVPSRTLTYTIRIHRWLPQKMDWVVNVLSSTREGIISSIDDVISQISEIINDIEAGKDYDYMSEEHNFETSLKLVDIFSLPIKLNRKQKVYPMIEMAM